MLVQLRDHPELCPVPILSVTQFEAYVDALAAAEVAAEIGGPATHDRRDVAHFKVVAGLDFIRAHVQWLADNDRENVAVYAARAGMTTSGKRNRSYPPLTAKKSKTMVHGIDVTALVTHSRQTHQWLYSIDGGRTCSMGTDDEGEGDSRAVHAGHDPDGPAPLDGQPRRSVRLERAVPDHRHLSLRLQDLRSGYLRDRQLVRPHRVELGEAARLADVCLNAPELHVGAPIVFDDVDYERLHVEVVVAVGELGTKTILLCLHLGQR